MSLLSSWYDIDVRVRLFADGVWEAEDSKTCFFGVVVDIFDLFFWKKYQFPCPQCKLVLKIENMINEDMWERSTNQKLKGKYWWMIEKKIG